MHRSYVLIIDDDPAICQLLSQKLAGQAFFCIVAPDGEQALEEARRRIFSVVLLDCRLPGISGLEVLHQLRTIQPDACVLMISGLDDLATAVEAMKLGAYDYITKPFDLADLLGRVHKALDRHRFLLERDDRERVLEERNNKMVQEMRQMVDQTVHSLVRQHLLEQRLDVEGSGKRSKKRDPKEFINKLMQIRRGTTA